MLDLRSITNATVCHSPQAANKAGSTRLSGYFLRFEMPNSNACTAIFAFSESSRIRVNGLPCVHASDVHGCVSTGRSSPSVESARIQGYPTTIDRGIQNRLQVCEP